ncbi:MAG: N-acetylmuramoyl-L-alanine amidase [Paracoccaceae bacterium]|nr:MAG: N-acetylmuramoyl-L-alanine amidase [Paracoccaceae bacterium]
MTFDIRDDHLVPLTSGHAVHPGWTAETGHRPMGVTWHWTAIARLDRTRDVLGGHNTRESKVSAHYGVGQSFAEGVDRYVRLENRSWHAQKNQKLRWDGKASLRKTSGIAACIGVETCHIGYARPGHPAGPDWIEAVDTNSSWTMKIAPWGEEQIAMMIAVGQEIVARWPHIRPEDHHGHHDICPGYKQDVAGFPFARVLRGIYGDDTIRDVWTPLWTTRARQRVLIALGHDLGTWKDDGHWGNFSQRALERFQRATGQVPIPYWTSFTNRAADAALAERGMDLATVAATPA